MREYLFIDDARLRRLAEQLERRALERKATRVAATLRTILSYERTSEWGVENRHFVIERVVEALREDGSLGAIRPMNDPSMDPLPTSQRAIDEAIAARGRYIYEEMIAEKVILHRSTGPAKDLPALAIWISDPDESLLEADASLVAHEWDALRGSYLYLLEAHWPDTEGEFPLLSGLSALQMVANISVGVDPLARGHQEQWEPFGRGVAANPIEKLRSLGITTGEKRHIASMYRVRLVSNEQKIRRGDHEFRTHDVLGYPVFIEEL